MRPKKLALGIVTVGTAISTVFAFNLSVPFFRLQVLGQSRETSKSEVERLWNLCRENFQKNQFQAALQSCQQSAMTAQRIGNHLIQAKSLGMLGLTYSNIGNVEKAIDSYQKALAISREIKDPQLETVVLQGLFLAKFQNNPRKPEADRLFDLGTQQFQNSKFKAASQSWEQALLIYREIKYPVDEVSTLINLGNAYNNLGNFPKAIEFLEQSLGIAREIKYRQGEGDTLRNLGLAYLEKGDYPKAIDYSEQSLAITREIKDRKGEGQSLGNLGLAYASMGDYLKAINHHQQSLVIAQEIKDPQGEVKSLTNLGNVYLNQGNYPKAIESQQQSFALAQKINDPSSEGRALGNLGNVYFYLGDYQKAVDYHNKSLVIARKIKNLKGEVQLLGNLGADYLYLGYDQKAIYYQQQSLAIAQKIEDRQSEGNALGNLGDIYTKLGDYPKAINYHQQHLTVARKITDRKGESVALGNIGLVYSYQGNYPKAIDYSQDSLVIAREINDPQSQGDALNNLGFYFYKQGNLKLAESTLFEGMTVRESLRGRELKDSEKVSIFDKQRNTYRALQQVFIAQNKNDAALEIAERGRARAFVELLYSRLSPQLQQKLPPPATIEEIKQIAKSQNATIVEYSVIYDKFKVEGKPQFKESELYIWVIKPTGEINFRRTDLKHLWQQQNISLRDKVAQARQSIVKGVNVASRGNNITLTPGDHIKLKDDLPTWEAWEVLSVNPQKQTITVWLPSGGTGTKSDRPMTDVVEKVTNSASANTKNSQLQELYQLLIQPIADLLPKEETARVIFIPQDALFLVPFPALQDPSGQYLIDKHTILTAPSIQVLDSTNKLRQKVPGSAKDVLVVGNPTMPKVSKKTGEAPQQLSALPSSEKEALVIASFWKTQALIGNQATKNTVLQKLPKAKIIHLATHGLLDDIRGLGSSIVFAPEGQDNGLLTAEDILNLYAPPQGSVLSAELVVLSACDTGQGRLTGDGVIGLSRSIIAAGVPSVIVSLWSIPDAPTAELMTEFYENFRKNPDKATALRQAMLTTKKKHPNPADWAAFTLIGESE
ncbi:CHAT domain-containing protein [Nostoc sp.]|uniref:CHAT domain-containing protein n=1 Tax=Nostoc sp. TaxID=1180 RepID=UPI002FF6E967